MSCQNSIYCLHSGLDFAKKENKFLSLTVDFCSMSQQGGGLEMGKMIEEQHVQVLQHGDEEDGDDDNDEYEDD